MREGVVARPDMVVNMGQCRVGNMTGGSSAKRGLAMLQLMYGGMRRDLARLLAVVETNKCRGKLVEAGSTAGSQQAGRRKV